MPSGLNDTSQFPAKDPLIRQHLQDYLDSRFTVAVNGAEGWEKNTRTGKIDQWGAITVSGTTNCYIPCSLYNC